MTEGSLKADRDGAYLAVVVRDHLHLPLAQKGYGLLPVDNLQGFVGCVEEERLLHTGDNAVPGCTVSSDLLP